MSYMDILRPQLVIDEGERRFPYVDTVGKITIGVGRNLTDVGISKDEQDFLFAHDLTRAVSVAVGVFPTFDNLSDNRKAVLCNMAFNLGYTTLSQFHATIAAVTAKDFERASQQMLKSLWAAQVGDRAKRLATLMRTG